MSFLANGEVSLADRSSVFFFVESTPSGQFCATAVNSSGQVWTFSYSSENWIKLYEEGGASSNEEFFEWLNDPTCKVTAERNGDSLELKWTKEDEEGFYFEVCSLRLSRKPSDALLTLIRSLLNDRAKFHEKAASYETQLNETQNQLEKLNKRAAELSEFCSNVESTLIAKFTTILNEKLKKS